MKAEFKFSYPSSEKVYLSGKLYPELKVGMRKVHLTPTVTIKKGCLLYTSPSPRD